MTVYRVHVVYSVYKVYWVHKVHGVYNLFDFIKAQSRVPNELNKLHELNKPLHKDTNHVREHYNFFLKAVDFRVNVGWNLP